MTKVEMVKFLKEERYHELNSWEKEFVSDIYENAQDDSELTTRQKDKILDVFMEHEL